MTAFDRALSFCLAHEGGFVDNPADPGGATNLGITLATLRAWRGAAVTVADVRALKRDEAAAIYRAYYWEPIQGDALPPALALLVFDAAINSGVTRAKSWLQQACGVRVDYRIGPVTLAAAQRGGRAVCIEFVALRTAYLGALPSWRTFGLGWSRRLAALPYEAMEMGQ